MWRPAILRSQGEEQSTAPGSGPGKSWEQQATGWILAYRFGVVVLLIIVVADARAGRIAAERTLQLTVRSQATLADFKDEVDDLEHR